MTQREKRTFLIQKLIDEQPRYGDLQIPSSEAEQKTLLRRGAASACLRRDDEKTRAYGGDLQCFQGCRLRNYGEATCPEKIADRSIVVNADIGEVVSALLDEADGSDGL